MKKVENMSLKVLKNEWDVYFDMALAMLDVIMKNNAAGKRTVMIVPVGPTDQYPILAKLVNQLRVSLKDVWFFNMDEYMISKTESIAADHPMSFKGRMKREFYARIDKDLVMPEEQRLFPEPGKEKEYDTLIESLGGKMESVTPMGRKQFTYEIDKRRAGLYFDFVFELAAAKVKDIKEKYKLDQRILRNMIISYDRPADANDNKLVD